MAALIYILIHVNKFDYKHAIKKEMVRITSVAS